MHQNNVVRTPAFNGLPILLDPTRDQACHGEILDALQSIFSWTTGRHCKVMLIRLDVRFPSWGEWPADNSVLEGFIANYVKHMSRQGLDPKYLWAREQSTAPTPHYHICLWLDGSKTQSPNNWLTLADELWARALGLQPGCYGLIEYCLKDRAGNPQRNGIMIRRGSPDFESTMAECFRWASYLAKTSTKGRGPTGVKNFSCSRLN